VVPPLLTASGRRNNFSAKRFPKFPFVHYDVVKLKKVPLLNLFVRLYLRGGFYAGGTSVALLPFCKDTERLGKLLQRLHDLDSTKHYIKCNVLFNASDNVRTG
jgi:hypothetical protein